MKARPTFDASLRLGKAGEDFIRRAHPEYVVPSDPTERRWDLISLVPPFPRLECKSDQWGHDDTPNHFWEKSTTVRGRAGFLLGGPWRAERDGVDELVYLFPNGGTRAAPKPPVAYWFRSIPALVARLNELIARRPRVAEPRRVGVGGKLTANGYLVPRELLADVAGASMVEYEPTEVGT